MTARIRGQIPFIEFLEEFAYRCGSDISRSCFHPLISPKLRPLQRGVNLHHGCHARPVILDRQTGVRYDWRAMRFKLGYQPMNCQMRAESARFSGTFDHRGYSNGSHQPCQNAGSWNTRHDEEWSVREFEFPLDAVAINQPFHWREMRCGEATGDHGVPVLYVLEGRCSERWSRRC